MGVRGDCVHVSRPLEPGIDPVFFTELTDPADARGDRAARPHRCLGPIQLNQAVQLIPPAAGKTTVAPARPAAADVLLEDHNAELGVGLAQEVSGPESGESAADDRYVCVDVLQQWRGRRAAFKSQRLPQPPTPLGTGRECAASQVQARNGLVHRDNARMTLSTLLLI